jgi:hypothetical protein
MEFKHPNFYNPYVACCHCLDITKDYDYFCDEQTHEEYAICDKCFPFVKKRGVV